MGESKLEGMGYLPRGSDRTLDHLQDGIRGRGKGIGRRKTMALGVGASVVTAAALNVPVVISPALRGLDARTDHTPVVGGLKDRILGRYRLDFSKAPRPESPLRQKTDGWIDKIQNGHEKIKIIEGEFIVNPYAHVRALPGLGPNEFVEVGENQSFRIFNPVLYEDGQMMDPSNPKDSKRWIMFYVRGEKHPYFMQYSSLTLEPTDNQRAMHYKDPENIKPYLQYVPRKTATVIAEPQGAHEREVYTNGFTSLSEAEKTDKTPRLYGKTLQGASMGTIAYTSFPRPNQQQAA